MKYWVDVGILVLISGGLLQGYLWGLKKAASLLLLLLICLLISLAFGHAGEAYMTAYYNMDSRVMPILLERLPLALPVSSSAPALDVNARALHLVENLPISPVFQDWLVGWPQFSSGLWLEEDYLVANVFSDLLLTMGSFLVFFCAFLVKLKIISALITSEVASQRPGGVTRFGGALVGGMYTTVVLSVFFTALSPFFSLFFNVLAWDVASSRMVGILLKGGLFLFSGIY